MYTCMCASKCVQCMHVRAGSHMCPLHMCVYTCLHVLVLELLGPSVSLLKG